MIYVSWDQEGIRCFGCVREEIEPNLAHGRPYGVDIY
jgi:hypothetical protein